MNQFRPIFRLSATCELGLTTTGRPVGNRKRPRVNYSSQHSMLAAGGDHATTHGAKYNIRLATGTKLHEVRMRSPLTGVSFVAYADVTEYGARRQKCLATALDNNGYRVSR